MIVKDDKQMEEGRDSKEYEAKHPCLMPYSLPERLGQCVLALFYKSNMSIRLTKNENFFCIIFMSVLPTDNNTSLH